jgi:hypothetical protein
VVATQSQTSPAPSYPPGNLTKCDANISATSDVSCPFAENTFYEYYTATNGNASEQTTAQAWSPATQQSPRPSPSWLVRAALDQLALAQHAQHALVVHGPAELADNPGGDDPVAVGRVLFCDLDDRPLDLVDGRSRSSRGGRRLGRDAVDRLTADLQDARQRRRAVRSSFLDRRSAPPSRSFSRHVYNGFSEI